MIVKTYMCDWCGSEINTKGNLFTMNLQPRDFEDHLFKESVLHFHILCHQAFCKQSDKAKEMASKALKERMATFRSKND